MIVVQAELGGAQLYNLKSDPRQIDNVIEKSVDLAGELRNFLLEFETISQIPGCCHSERPYSSVIPNAAQRSEESESEIVACKPISNFRFLASLEVTGTNSK